MAIERFAPTVYLTRANLRSSPGPLVQKFAICVDGPPGVYRFALGSTDVDDDWTTIVPQGGAAGAWELMGFPDRGTNLTNASATLQPGDGSWSVLPAATLTANRTLTLGTTNAREGYTRTITRLDTTAYTYTIANGGVGGGTLTVFPRSVVGSAVFYFDGTNWTLRHVSGGTGAAAVATYADLPASAAPGDRRWVTSRGVEYIYTTSWQASGITDPAWANATIYVASTGSADGAGTSGDPLSSLADVMLRLGRNNPQQIQVYVLDALGEASIEIEGPCIPDLNHWITISAAPAAVTVAQTTTLSAVTAWVQNASTNTVGTITGTTSFAAHAGSGVNAGKRFRIAGGARDGALGVLGAVESGTAVVFAPPQVALYTIGTVVPQTGDTVEILSAPPLLCEKLYVGHGVSLWIDHLTIGAGDAHAVTVGSGATLYLSACVVDGGIDALNAGSYVLTACECKGSLRTYGDADGDGGNGSMNVYGCHTQTIEVRKQGKATFGDVYSRHGMSFGQLSCCQIASGTFLYVDTPAGSTALVASFASKTDAAGALNGRGVTASPGTLVLGVDATIAYGVKPNFTGGSGSLWYFDASNNGNAAALPAAHPTNGAKIVLRTY